MGTTRETTCPVCGAEESTEYVALLPITREGENLEPHRYSVCPGCYIDQWAMLYGKDVPCPIKAEMSSTLDKRQPSSSTPSGEPAATS